MVRMIMQDCIAGGRPGRARLGVSGFACSRAEPRKHSAQEFVLLVEPGKKALSDC